MRRAGHKLVSITDPGRQELERARHVRREVHDRMTTSLTPAEVIELRRLLRKVIEAGGGPRPAPAARSVPTAGGQRSG